MYAASNNDVNATVSSQVGDARKMKLPWHKSAWSLPWIILFLALYTFTIPWIWTAIIDAYLVRRSWDHALPGLGTTLARRISMGSHMTFGAAALLLGPTQFVTSVRRKTPAVHRWCGRLYVLCAMGASVFGLVFIVLKRGELVGGVNMALAFGSAGITFGWCAAAAYLEAKSRRWQSHRAWTVRSFSQILAPMLYRYWYFAADVVGLYRYTYMPGDYDPSRDCDADTGICPLFLRPFDAIHCWTYWLSSLAVAELIVKLLPPLERAEGKEGAGASARQRSDREEVQPLNKEAEVDYGGVVNNATDENSGDGVSVKTELNGVMGLNALGVLLAAITSILTVKMFMP